MKYTETRILSSSKLRSLCIKHDWYTCGNNAQYAAMFAKLHDDDGNLVHMSTEKLYEIASDIYAHSDINDYTVEAIMAELARQCLYFFDEE